MLPSETANLQQYVFNEPISRVVTIFSRVRISCSSKRRSSWLASLSPAMAAPDCSRTILLLSLGDEGVSTATGVTAAAAGLVDDASCWPIISAASTVVYAIAAGGAALALVEGGVAVFVGDRIGVGKGISTGSGTSKSTLGGGGIGDMSRADKALLLRRTGEDSSPVCEAALLLLDSNVAYTLVSTTAT
jgi:hypothetical protein